MRVVAIQLSESDIRCFKVEVGYRLGHYLEKNTPAEQNSAGVTLVVARVPTGMQAPKGRLSHAQLQALADEGLKEVQPEVIARFPYWSYIVNNGKSVETVGEADGDTVQVPVETNDGGVRLCEATVEPLVILPPSIRDRLGLYVLPKDAYTPIKTFEAPKPKDEADKPAKPAKEV